MPIPQTTEFSLDFLICRKYYLFGQRYNPEMTALDSESAQVEHILNNYIWEQRKISELPHKITYRHIKTHYLTYSVLPETRNSENELEFRELENAYSVKFKEIWRCFYKPQNVLHPDSSSRIEDIKNLGNFFLFPYKDLEGLIRNNMIQGWKKEEVIASIHNLLESNLDDLLNHEREKIEQLRRWVNQNPEVLAA
ncbi:MAG: hypothetical protein PUP92_13055 [Rhizonema sp. PD38]|nr:hypothetical protein [Rhizonema sp. PD38]